MITFTIGVSALALLILLSFYSAYCWGDLDWALADLICGYLATIALICWWLNRFMP